MLYVLQSSARIIVKSIKLRKSQEWCMFVEDTKVKWFENFRGLCSMTIIIIISVIQLRDFYRVWRRLLIRENRFWLKNCARNHSQTNTLTIKEGSIHKLRVHLRGVKKFSLFVWEKKRVRNRGGRGSKKSTARAYVIYGWPLTAILIIYLQFTQMRWYITG